MNTDRILVFSSDGRFFTLTGDKLPGGRGHGEPLRLLIEMGSGAEIVGLFVHRPGGKMVIASAMGRGFVVREDDVIAQTRNGKQILNLADGDEARICHRLSEDDDHVAVIGENRKLLLFPLEELPEMSRGKGVLLQRFKSGGLSDATTFTLARGLSWPMGERTRTETNLGEWLGHRAQAGRQPPRGFPRSNRFS